MYQPEAYAIALLFMIGSMLCWGSWANTSSSWLNQVERWFGLITERRIRRGTFLSVQQLEQAIYEWLAKWSRDPKPFIWKATADIILDKVQRCKQLSETPH